MLRTLRHAATSVALGAALLPQAATGAEDVKARLTPQRIAERIQTHRTAEVTLTLTGPDGRPLANTAVTVEQVRHKFLFGCNAFKIDAGNTSQLQRDYRQRFSALLNYATLPFYWGSYERQRGATRAQRVRGMAQWCKENGIRTKGHPLCWHQLPPRWAAGTDLGEFGKLQLGRITREVTAFAGLIDTWDVVNEAVVMPNYRREPSLPADLCRKLGRLELVKQTFAAAAKANPKAELVLNDYDTSEKFAGLIRQCLDAEVKIDVIGIQSHMHSGYRGDEWAWNTCERFAKFGKPLHFTEATIISGAIRQRIPWTGPKPTDWHTTPEGEKRQADEVEQFYTVLFSHPAVEAITWWDFADGAWMGAPAGLVRKDMTPKPAYERLMKLIKGEWWTAKQKLKTDAAGRVTFRGYLGEYNVRMNGATVLFRLDKAGKAALDVRMGKG